MRAASTLKVPPFFDNPYALPEPMSPHLAARLAGAQIDRPTSKRVSTPCVSMPTWSWWKGRRVHRAIA